MMNRTQELFYYGKDGIYMIVGKFKNMNLNLIYLKHGDELIDWLSEYKTDWRLTIRQKIIIGEVIKDLMTNYYKIK